MALADVLASRNQPVVNQEAVSYEQARPLLKFVYIWMFFGLFITAAAAFMTTSTPALLSLATNPLVMIVAIIAQFGLVLGLNFGLNRLSPNAAAAIFMIYAGLMGFTLSTIFLVFSLGSIAAAFMSTAGMFAAMTVFGFTTKMDLTRFGSYLMIGLIGLIIASFVNVLLAGGALSFIISVIGILLFLGLTAYDTQNLKRMAAHPEVQADHALATKLGIFGALSLYLNFINIFLFLLQLFGVGGDE